MSLPAASVAGRLRVTEQGEVVAERYGDPLVAHRHLEQLTWATMLVSAEMEPPPDPQWIARLSAAADEGYQAYRRLVEDPDFPAVLQPRHADRSHRVAAHRLATQSPEPAGDARSASRHPLHVRLDAEPAPRSPASMAWGAALPNPRPTDWQAWTDMYRGWSFFRALIDNAELALSKADPGIVRHYASMVSDPAHGPAHPGPDRGASTSGRGRPSCGSSRRGELLETTPWLKRSVALRNPRVDLLELHPG